jgi:ADP-heptose:LPS heptosyltransferase/GT2 family glycosyltransferase
VLKVRIVILNYNGTEILAECLPSFLEALRRSSHPAALTVLDNRSTDGSVAWLKTHFPEVETVVARENLLLVSFNDYVAQAKEDVVILMNNDIRVDSGFIDPLVRVFEERSDAFLASPQTLSFDGARYEGGRSRAKIRWGLFWSSSIFPGSEALQGKAGHTFASGFGAFHRKRFLALKGYDDLYLPGIIEDADLGFRAWREGFRSYYVPESKVYHLGQASFKKAFGEKRILTLAHRNSFLFIWKNLKDVSLWLEHFVFLIPRLLSAAVSGKAELAIGFFEALRRLPEAIKRRRFPLKRSRSDREVFRLANEAPSRRRYVFKKKWKRLAAGIIDGLGGMLFFPLRPVRRRTASPRRILVVRIDSMGDGVLSLPAVEALKSRFPEAGIDFLVSRAVRDLYRPLFPKAELHVFESNWLTGKAPWREVLSETRRLAGRLRERRYDLGVDFRGDFRTLLLMTAGGIKRRWGSCGTGGKFLMERAVERKEGEHVAVGDARVVQENGRAPSAEFPKIEIPPSVQGKVQDWLAALEGKRKIVIHTGAGYPSKRWGAGNFVELGRQIREKRLGVPIYVGTDEEKRCLEPYQDKIDFSLMGKTSLEELLALLKEADLFIGNDSGPAHLAGLLGRKLLVIFSGTNDFREWAPRSLDRVRVLSNPVPCAPCEERVCPLKKQICLEAISVEEVVRAAEEILQS